MYIYLTVEVILQMNCIVNIMVSMLNSSAIDYGFETLSCLTKYYVIIYVASLLSTQHKGVGSKTEWLRIRIMCESEGTPTPATDWMAQNQDNV